MLLIFTEIIEINVCDLEKNTRKNIQLREENEFNNLLYKDTFNEDDDYGKENVELNGGIEIELKTDQIS